MDHSEALYERANRAIGRYLEDHVKPALGELQGEYVLRAFARAWENHKLMVKWVQQLFRHLDNGYIANSSVATLTSCGLRQTDDEAVLEQLAHVEPRVRHLDLAHLVRIQPYALAAALLHGRGKALLDGEARH